MQVGLVIRPEANRLISARVQLLGDLEALRERVQTARSEAAALTGVSPTPLGEDEFSGTPVEQFSAAMIAYRQELACIEDLKARIIWLESTNAQLEAEKLRRDAIRIGVVLVAILVLLICLLAQGARSASGCVVGWMPLAWAALPMHSISLRERENPGCTSIRSLGQQGQTSAGRTHHGER